jgi:succinate dehydrogenase / fumarate reductase membrane anchor subunit
MRTSRPIRSAGFIEFVLWLFTRFSGLLLLLFAAISMGVAFSLGGRTLLDLPTMTRWVFFPNPNHVVNSDIPDVSVGWSNAFWQIFSVLMIFLAAGHGINGVRMVLEDYIKRPLLVALLRILLFML